MKTIIKLGTVPKTKVYEITCNKCNTIFQCDISDFTESVNKGFSRLTTTSCPVCKTALPYTDFLEKEIDIEFN